MILVGNCLKLLATLGPGSVQTCVTSPPYFGLRDYGVEGQHGSEKTPEAFVETMVAVFAQVRRVLRDDGTLWLNLGDSYNNFRSQMGPGQAVHGRDRLNGKPAPLSSKRGVPGLKEKELIGIPWLVAFALRADGWYLRQEIIWSKPNPMPESVSDRCTKAHEHIFLLSKSPKYYFDQEAIREPLAASSVARLSQATLDIQRGSSRVPGKTNGNMKAVRRREDLAPSDTRNKRSVWTVPTMPFREAHFATFPEALIEPCIRAGSRPGDLVLDPYLGAGTTAVVCERLARRWIGCELNPAYAALAERRVHTTHPGLAL